MCSKDESRDTCVEDVDHSQEAVGVEDVEDGDTILNLGEGIGDAVEIILTVSWTRSRLQRIFWPVTVIKRQSSRSKAQARLCLLSRTTKQLEAMLQ